MYVHVYVYVYFERKHVSNFGALLECALACLLLHKHYLTLSWMLPVAVHGLRYGGDTAMLGMYVALRG